MPSFLRERSSLRSTKDTTRRQLRTRPYDVEDPAIRGRFEAVWKRPIPPKRGYHLSQMFEAMEHGELKSAYIVGENPARSEADQTRAVALLSGLDHLVVQDIFLTQTAELAHVVLPAAAGWAESEGTVTNSERRVQRVRRALEPPEGARDDIAIVCEIARRNCAPPIRIC